MALVQHTQRLKVTVIPGFSPLGWSVVKHTANSPPHGGDLALLKVSSHSSHSLWRGRMWTRKRGKSHLLGTVTPPKLPKVRLKIPYSQIKYGRENLWFISVVFVPYLLKVCSVPNSWVALNFEHFCFLTVPDSWCFERFLRSRTEPFRVCRLGLQPRAWQRVCNQLMLVEWMHG